MFDWRFDLFSILISELAFTSNCSFTFDITLSTQNRVAHNVWKICPYRGTLNYFQFWRDFLFADLFGSLIARVGIVIYCLAFWFHRTGIQVKFKLLIWGFFSCVWIQGLHWYLCFAGLIFVFGFKNCVGCVGHFSIVGSNITFPRVLLRVRWILRIFSFWFFASDRTLGFRVRRTMSQPEIPTWSQQPMPLKSYQPCFVDVRRAVIACAEDQNSLVLKPRTWQRISASASVIYKSVLSELTIKKEGWSELQNRNTCKIRPDK